MAVQLQGIRKKYGYTRTTTVSERPVKETKQKERNWKLDMEQYIKNRTSQLNNPLVTKAPKVTEDALKPSNTLSSRLNHDKTHCPTPVTS